MSYNEEFYRRKLLNNEFIEDGSCWVASDRYYGQSEDLSLGSYIKENSGTEFGIRNIVFMIFRNLVNRYHNNFYLDFKEFDDSVVFILRGQPAFNDCYLHLVVRYTITFVPGNCNLSCSFVQEDDPDFMFDKNLVANYRQQSSLGIFGKLKKLAGNDGDNSLEVKSLIDSISLQSYINRISNSAADTSSGSNISQSNNTHKVQSKSLNNPHKVNENTRHVDLGGSTQKTTTPLERKEELKTEHVRDWSSSDNKQYLLYCTECGQENYPLNTYCSNCNKPLLTHRIEYGHMITSFDEILTRDAIRKIDETVIPWDFYEYVKHLIMSKCEKIDFSDDVNVYDKILRICRHYANIMPNDEIEGYGEYNFNSILFNPTVSRSKQCATLIKYLSVDIHIEIMEYLFMYIFDVKNNVYAKSLINFSRNNLQEIIIEKYYQTRVESHFIPDEYHNYEEVDRLYLDCVVYNKHMEEDNFNNALVVGNTYSKEIIGILEKVITPDIQKELEEEFSYDKPERGDDMRRYDSDEVITNENLLIIYKESLQKTIEFLMENKEAREGLNEMKEVFENVVNS